MSNFSIGTLVMMKAPANYQRSEGAPPDGAIGEIMDAGRYKKELGIAEVCVDFPSHPSNTTTSWWSIPTSFLIPLSDPDLDVTETEENPIEEKV